jgi:hypothetical protein
MGLVVISLAMPKSAIISNIAQREGKPIFNIPRAFNSKLDILRSLGQPRDRAKPMNNIVFMKIFNPLKTLFKQTFHYINKSLLREYLRTTYIEL